MDLPQQFRNFLSDIRPTANQRQNLIRGHKTLRDRLEGDDKLSPHIVATFLQGSYRRYTAVRPVNDLRADVDIVVVTSLDEGEYDPKDALDLFVPFLEKYYEDKWRMQGRSLGIQMSYVDLDIVPTSAPSEAVTEEVRAFASDSMGTDENLENLFANESWGKGEELLETRSAWKDEPLRIPDRHAQRWEDTHPLAQTKWTQQKNKACNGHYVNVVKALKWWRREQDPGEHPKGYPFEHLLGSVCPDSIRTVAEGVTRSLEGLVSQFGSYADTGQVPVLQDHGVNQNVLGRVTPEEFREFMEQVRDAAELARRALDEEDKQRSGQLWKQLFGGTFPDPPDRGRGGEDGGDDSDGGGFSERTAGTTAVGQRFA